MPAEGAFCVDSGCRMNKMDDWSLSASEDNMNIVQVSWRRDASSVDRFLMLVSSGIHFTFT